MKLIAKNYLSKFVESMPDEKLQPKASDILRALHELVQEPEEDIVTLRMENDAARFAMDEQRPRFLAVLNALDKAVPHHVTANSEISHLLVLTACRMGCIPIVS